MFDFAVMFVGLSALLTPGLHVVCAGLPCYSLIQYVCPFFFDKTTKLRQFDIILLVTNISPPNKGTLESMLFPFPKVGYVSVPGG